MEAIPSTHHQKLKFLLQSSDGRIDVVTIKGDQQAAKQCLMAVVSGEEEPRQVHMAELEANLDSVGRAQTKRALKT